VDLIRQLLATLKKGQIQHLKCFIKADAETIWVYHPYNERLVDIDRRLRGRRYNREKKCSHTSITNFDDVIIKYFEQGFYFHECFFTEVEKLLDGGFDLHDTQIQRMGDIINRFNKYSDRKPTPSIAESFQKKDDFALPDLIVNRSFRAYKHQRVGVGFLLESKEAVLGDEMGLGKSMQIILASSYMLYDKSIDKVLIVCPNSMKLNWLYEIKKFTSFTGDDITIIEGTPGKRKKQILNSGSWMIVNYELLRIEDTNILDYLKDFSYSMICDESHRIKSPKAKQSVACLKVGEFACRKYLLTGTIVANKPEDVWNQIRFLDNGRILGSWLSFRKQYCIEKDIKFGRRYVRKIVGYRNLDDLKDKINSVMLRRTKDKCLDLPQKIFQTIPVRMTDKQAALYRKIAEGILKEIEIGEDGKLEIDNILSKMLYALEVASSPTLIDPNAAPEDSGKLAVLDELLDTYIKEGNKKVILWTFFVKNIESFNERYKQYNPVTYYGKTSPKSREKALEDFQHDDNTRLFIGNPQAAGIGLTLTSSSTCIFYDRNFSYVDFKQAVDRIHRIGQHDICHVITLQAEKTIDQYVEALIERKQETAAYLQGDEYKNNKPGNKGKSDNSRLITLNKIADYLQIGGC